MEKSPDLFVYEQNNYKLHDDEDQLLRNMKDIDSIIEYEQKGLKQQEYKKFDVQKMHFR